MTTEHSQTTAPNGDRHRDRMGVFVNKTDYGRFSNVLVCLLDYQDNIIGVVPSFTIERNTADHFAQRFIDPTIDGPMATDFLQAALDAAWAAGLRPKNYRDERPEQVKAMDNHLQDMRALVFGGPVPLPDFIKKGSSNVG